MSDDVPIQPEGAQHGRKENEVHLRLFEWDEGKWRLNLEKHKVDFYDAILVFENETVEAPDEKREYGETRFNALGHVDDEFYMVTYTWRGESRRIISAWKVGKNGQRRYRERLAQRGAKEA